MSNQAGDYGGLNAIANRQAAAQKAPSGAIGSVISQAIRQPSAPVRSTPKITSGPSGHYSPITTPPVQPGPVAVNPDQWLAGDSGYQDQLRQIGLALSNFGADVTRRQGEANTDYTSSQHALNDQKVVDLKNLESDWAGRGLIKSGLYANAVGNYNKEFDQRLADLTSSRDKTLAQILQEQNNFTTQEDLAKQAARADALRRMASGLGTVG